jgi:hypothetical protein
VRVVWSNRQVLDRMNRRCACGHRDWEHGLWVDGPCIQGCTCPGFTSRARVRLASRWSA